MTMHICPSCGKNNTVISDDGKKGFCISCGQPFTVEEQNEKAWNEGLDDREQYWCQELFKVAPVSLALSYQQLFDYIKEGNIGCTLFLIRDVYELFMKIPVIVLFNGVYSVIENKKDITKFLEQHPRFTKVYRSSAQVFTSGKWMEAVRNGAALTKEIRPDVFDKDQLYIETVNYLASIENEFNFLDPKKGRSNKGEPSKVSNMSEWRNRALGHGCLARDPEESYQEIPYILKMFKHIGELSLEYYNNVSFKCGHVRLRGVDTFPNIKGKISIVCGGLGKEKEYNIHEFVTAQEKNLAYYDGYNRGKAFLLDYGDGNRYKDKALTEFLQKHLDALKNNSAFTLSSESAEADNLEEADIRELEERLRHHDSIVYIDSLYKWIQNAMDSCDKGLLLLQMERGMGKTTFCDTIDQLSDSDIVREYSADIPGWTEFMANTVIRVWHFNSTYRGRPEVYIDGIKNALLTVQNDKKNNRLTGTLNEVWDGLLHCEKELRHIQFAEALNQTAEAQMRSSSRGKVLLVLDGIDEITDLKTLKEYLPKQNELAPNVYILLTCRTDEEIVDQQNNFVQQNTFASRLIYTRNAVQENLVMKKGINNEYQEAVKQYLKEAFPVKLTEKEIVQIVKHFDYRFSDIAAYKDLCQVSPVFQKLESTSLIDQFMKEVEANAPEIYKNKMERILQCLTWTGSELSLREIAYFVGEGYVSYQLIGMMDELRAFVRVVRTGRGNCYEISHESWLEELTNRELRGDLDGGVSFVDHCNILLSELEKMKETKYLVNALYNKVTCGETCLFLNITKIYYQYYALRPRRIECDRTDLVMRICSKILSEFEKKVEDQSTDINNEIAFINSIGVTLYYYYKMYYQRYKRGKLNSSVFKKYVRIVESIIKKYEINGTNTKSEREFEQVAYLYFGVAQLYDLFLEVIGRDRKLSQKACELSAEAANLLTKCSDRQNKIGLVLRAMVYSQKYSEDKKGIYLRKAMEYLTSLKEVVRVNAQIKLDEVVIYRHFARHYAKDNEKMFYYNRALDILTDLENEVKSEYEMTLVRNKRIWIYRSIAEYFYEKKDYMSAKEYWETAIEEFDKVKKDGVFNEFNEFVEFEEARANVSANLLLMRLEGKIY